MGKDWSTPEDEIQPPPHPRAENPPIPYVEQARNMVYAKIVQQRKDKGLSEPDVTKFTIHDVHVVWFCKTLQHWKGLLITTFPDELYYEVTFNGLKKEVYIDTYVKVENQAYTFEEAAL